ncbi:MAG: 16S rRNA (cytosine(967)-C(5))-methyltransferase RsmB, partial [Lachnospiraceae bacterium]|nr:16S rRNA (cytosine(967)-C(5))-methyltransferase RsmB [Lachnospiraceae bacterium]
YDFDRVESMLIAFLEKDDTTIRVNTCKTDVKTLKEKLESQGITVEDAPYVDEALRISGFNYLDSMAEFKDGLFTIQDVSSMLVGKVAGVKSGDYVIDVCAAPGGKSLHVAELLKGTGYVEARDLSENKVELIRDNIERMGFVNIAARTKDALVFDELSEEKADIVLADLPCSGLGVIGNKVDLKYKMSATAITELEELQRNILAVVNRYVKLGGVLIYSTCTINPGENIDNVRWFAKTFNFELESISEYLPEALRSETTDEGYIQLLPSVHDCDGFFVARLKRVK